jgi:hypothetical protein
VSENLKVSDFPLLHDGFGSRGFSLVCCFEGVEVRKRTRESLCFFAERISEKNELQC